MGERVEMTPEVRAALLSKVPFSTSATLEYTPKAFLIENSEGELLIPEELRPVFVIRPFTKAESDIVRKVCNKGESASVREWARKIIMGWDKLVDAGSMEFIEYVADPLGGCEKNLFDTLPEHITTDLLLYTTGISGILDKDKLGF